MNNNKTAVRHVYSWWRNLKNDKCIWSSCFCWTANSESGKWVIVVARFMHNVFCFDNEASLIPMSVMQSSVKVGKVILRMKHRTQCWAQCCTQQFKSRLNKKVPSRCCQWNSQLQCNSASCVGDLVRFPTLHLPNSWHLYIEDIFNVPH